jgi:Tfp pilus assembly protein PilN
MKTHVNLIPWKVRRNQVIRRRLLQWAVVWAAAAGAMVAIGAAKANQNAAVRQTLHALEAEYAPIAALRQEIGTCRQNLEAWSRREAAAAQLEDTRPALTLLGLVGHSARQCEGRLRVDQLTVRPREELPAAEKKPAGKHQNAGPSTLVTIKGVALDNPAVSRFVAALRQTQAFDRVELKSSAEQPTGDLKTCSYLVECSY